MRILSSHRLLQGVVLSMYNAARLLRPLRLIRKDRCFRRVVHISPAYFSDESQIGGGERYAMSLAEAMARHIDTVLVSFGVGRHRFRRGQLRVEIYPAIELVNGVPYDPLCYGFLRELVGADVIHCHQYRVGVTSLAIVAGALFQKKIFVTDLGGGGCHFGDSIPLFELLDGFLSISTFSAKMLPATIGGQVIYGGVNECFIKSEAGMERERKVIFVGRLLPHKGINYLIESIDAGVSLEIIGKVYHKAYFSLLGELAANKTVRFVVDASDEYLVKAYRSALVTVLPSVYTDVFGNRYDMPELLGLVLLESMACGTPVICTDVGGMPEFVEDGVTGFVVPPNDVGALRERINYLIRNPEIALNMGQKGREKVAREFTWEAVAGRCLDAYSRTQ